MSITVRTSGHLFHGFIRLSFLYVHRESSVLVREIRFLKNSDQFRFLSVSVVCLHNLKVSVGLITKKVSQWDRSSPFFYSDTKYTIINTRYVLIVLFFRERNMWERKKTHHHTNQHGFEKSCNQNQGSWKWGVFQLSDDVEYYSGSPGPGVDFKILKKRGRERNSWTDIFLCIEVKTET